MYQLPTELTGYKTHTVIVTGTGYVGMSAFRHNVQESKSPPGKMAFMPGVYDHVKFQLGHFHVEVSLFMVTHSFYVKFANCEIRKVENRIL